MIWFIGLPLPYIDDEQTQNQSKTIYLYKNAIKNLSNKTQF